MIKFYDTSSLLLLSELPKEKFALCRITLSELEEIKESSRKSEDIRAKARIISKQLFNNSNCIIVKPDPSWVNGFGL
jgi:hypothetical protein